MDHLGFNFSPATTSVMLYLGFLQLSENVFVFKILDNEGGKLVDPKLLFSGKTPVYGK